MFDVKTYVRSGYVKCGSESFFLTTIQTYKTFLGIPYMLVSSTTDRGNS
jgi:hypothetical protein